MIDSEIADKLDKLATDNSKRTKTAQLKDYIDYIERALDNGILRKDILKVLAESGLEVSLSTLTRLRKKRKIQAVEPISLPLPNKTSAPVVKTPLIDTAAAKSVKESGDLHEELAKQLISGKPETSLF